MNLPKIPTSLSAIDMAPLERMKTQRLSAKAEILINSMLMHGENGITRAKDRLGRNGFLKALMEIAAADAHCCGKLEELVMFMADSID